MKLAYAYNRFLKYSTDDNDDMGIYRSIYNVDADGWMVDRTETVTFPWQTKLLDQFKHVEPGSVYDFETCCLKTAESYLQQNKPIIIMWSGGIDSTAMLVAFLQATSDYSNITVAFNNDSIREYSSFYKKYICGKITGMSTEELLLKITTSGVGDSIVLSAEHADQLFGSPIAGTMLNTMGADFLNRPYCKENFEAFFSTRGASSKAADCWFDLYDQTIQHSPKPIQTMIDLAWWHGFNFRWQSIGLKIFPRINADTNYRTFFSSEDFQRWSIDQSFTMSNLVDLKSTPKNFIYKFTKDAEYRDTKIKHPSTTLYYTKPSASAVLEDLTKIYQANLNMMDYYDSDNSIAKWLKTH